MTYVPKPFVVPLTRRQKKFEEDILRGIFTEYLGKTYYKKEYLVLKLVFEENGAYRLNEVALSALAKLNPVHSELVDFIRGLKSVAGLPDYLLIKNFRPSFLECKARPGQLRPEQIKMFQKLEDLYYEVRIFCTPVELNLGFDKSVEYDWKEDKEILTEIPAKEYTPNQTNLASF